ncbi:MAG: tetratricopeptide repeat protein [Rhodanobacteraceae bacterium]
MSGEGIPSIFSNFFAELRRRRVIRVTVVYVLAGWAVIEAASTLLPGLHLPPWTVTFVIALVLLGFPIAVVMGWIFDIGPQGMQRTSESPQRAPEPEPSGGKNHGKRATDKQPGPGCENHDGHRSIAVLPFVNMSGDEENEYFSDGIAEEILNLLAKLPQLKVSSRTSSACFKGKDIDIPTVAKKLEVATVLEGSVRRAGNRVRITAQLIDAQSDSHLWSETYDREMEDVFAIQDDISSSIVDALLVKLSAQQRRKLQYVATGNAQAYDCYLRGHKYFYAMTRRGFEHAITMYRRALELDPNYAVAWAGMADAYSELYRYAEDTPENAAMALEASGRAVELDPQSAEAHTSRGIALSIGKRDAEAEQHFEKAIELNPRLFDAWFLYGRYCGTRGKWEKAASLYRHAAEVEPDNYNPVINLAMAYDALGLQEEKKSIRKKGLSLIEQHLQMAPDDARARYFGAITLASMGDRERALEWADMALESNENESNVVYNIACVFAQLGESERGMDLLERAVGLGWRDRAWLETDSDLACLRGMPRFTALLKDMH